MYACCFQPTTSRKSQGKPKPSKPNVIHLSLSLREDVKLRETENAWKPSRLKSGALDEEEVKTEALYKSVRSVLNKLTPQKFDTLIDQVRSLPIDTHERLQGVINLVFEKAVDEPSFSVAYALMCKELAMMEVAGSENQDSSVSFKKLIITRCQKEFERNLIDDVARMRKIKEIEECPDAVSVVQDVFSYTAFFSFVSIGYLKISTIDRCYHYSFLLLGEEERDAIDVRR